MQAVQIIRFSPANQQGDGVKFLLHSDYWQYWPSRHVFSVLKIAKWSNNICGYEWIKYSLKVWAESHQYVMHVLAPYCTFLWVGSVLVNHSKAVHNSVHANSETLVLNVAQNQSCEWRQKLMNFRGICWTISSSKGHFKKPPSPPMEEQRKTLTL